MPTYEEIALSVREIIFKTATPAALAQFGVHAAPDIPGTFNLGMPAPIGMTSNRIMLMLKPLNTLIRTSRSDQSGKHRITNTQLLAAKTVGDINDPTNLINLVWSKIQEL
jgi:hypothetical protein